MERGCRGYRSTEHHDISTDGTIDCDGSTEHDNITFNSLMGADPHGTAKPDDSRRGHPPSKRRRARRLSYRVRVAQHIFYFRSCSVSDFDVEHA